MSKRYKPGTFFIVAKSVFYDKTISITDRMVMVYILSKRSNWKFHQDLMCKEIGISKGTLNKSINNLKKNGYIVISKSIIRNADNTVSGLSTMYIPTEKAHKNDQTVKYLPILKKGIFSDTDIKIDYRYLGIYILDHQDIPNWIFTQKLIAYDLSVSISKVNSSIKVLKSSGYLSCTRKGSSSNELIYRMKDSLTSSITDIHINNDIVNPINADNNTEEENLKKIISDSYSFSDECFKLYWNYCKTTCQSGLNTKYFTKTASIWQKCNLLSDIAKAKDWVYKQYNRQNIRYTPYSDDFSGEFNQELTPISEETMKSIKTQFANTDISRQKFDDDISMKYMYTFEECGYTSFDELDSKVRLGYENFNFAYIPEGWSPTQETLNKWIEHKKKDV